MKVYDICRKFALVSDDIKPEESFYWVLTDVTELDKLKEKFSIDEDSIYECRDFDQSSRIEYYSRYIFLLINILDYNNGSVYSKELNIFLGRNYIITVYKDNIDIIDSLLKDIKDDKNSNLLKIHHEPAVLLYYILDRVIVKDYNIISMLEAQADKIEIRILKTPQKERIDQLITLRRQVYKVRKCLNPLRYIGDSLISNDNNVIENQTLKYFVRLNEKINKLMMSLESLVQDLGLVREAFEAEMQNKTNDLMKVFTIIAAIFLPLNLITGMYGMNFNNIPFIENEYGYYYVVLFMAILALCLIYIFRRKKWL